jgi:hypothetical protein
MNLKLSKKQIKKLKREGRLRDNLEIWIDKHNHKLELLRTFGTILSVSLSLFIFLRVFKVF